MTTHDLGGQSTPPARLIQSGASTSAVVLDMSQVRFIDAAAVRVILGPCGGGRVWSTPVRGRVAGGRLGCSSSSGWIGYGGRRCRHRPTPGHVERREAALHRGL